MSATGGALRWVMENSTLRSPSFTVILVLADFMDRGEGGMAWPSYETLAQRSRCSESTVRRALKEAEEVGEIQRLGASEAGTIIWSLTAEDLALPSGGVSPQNRGVFSQTTNASSIEAVSSKSKSSCKQEELFTLNVQGDSGGVPPSSVGGRKIRPEEWHVAVTIFERFNRLAGKNWEPRTTTGDHNPKITPIIMRIRENPEIDLDEHLAILDRNFAAPWWKGPVSGVGVIYGPQAFPRAVVCEGVTKRPATARSSHYARTAEKGGPGW